MKLLAALIIFLIGFQALAVTIEFPEEELARESVLPIFDNTVAVKSRRVTTAKRIELGIGTGFAMNEPFFNTMRFGGHVAYHFNETHGVVFMMQMYQGGLSKNGETLAGTDLVDDSPDSVQSYIRMNFAPESKYHGFLNYQITPYYGKISVFKDFVMNLSLYGLLGVGGVDIGGEFSPGLNVGIGQKFYFSNNWGIRADLSMLAYQGINYFAASDGSASPLENATSAKEVSEFEKRMNYDMQLSIALIILI
ncbi:MAG: outer membrane beta-barrel domain-containing protein [Bdellovibrionales bacterium]|nr:outer membrane beta-barrel domain-containing protein [Bdellovibrionales bacterium]